MRRVLVERRMITEENEANSVSASRGGPVRRKRPAFLCDSSSLFPHLFCYRLGCGGVDSVVAEVHVPMMRLIRTALVLVAFYLLTSAATAYAETRGEDIMVTNMDSGFWLTAYEHKDREWNTMASSWVHG